MPARPISAEFERRKRSLFEAALQLPQDRRLAYVQEQTNADAELRTAVLRLIAAEAVTSQGILDTPLHRRYDKEIAPLLRIGSYSVVSSLGTGGMGSVYCCRHPATNDLVAVKVIHEALRVKGFLERFAQEREILTKLKHPNVCRILEAGVANHGALFIVMEMVEGRPIDAFCRSLSTRAILRLFSQLLAGVEYFHRQQIIHRDLKPANVLVTDLGQVRILDFGIAKIIDHHPGSTGHGPTQTRSPLMTVRYASPEQLQGRLSGRASDIYALGVMIFELLTRRHPFDDEYLQGAVRLLSAMSRRSPPPASTVCPAGRISAAVDAMIARALEYDPLRRYRSAGDMLNDLRRCLESTSAASGA